MLRSSAAHVRLLVQFMVAEVLLLMAALLFPLTGEALEEQGEATIKKVKPTNAPEYASLGETNKEVTLEENAGAGKKIKTTHGCETGDLIVFTEINAKTTVGEEVAGLVIGVPYRLRKVAAGEFAIAYTKAGSESATEGEWVEHTATLKATTVFQRVIECNVVARTKVEWTAIKKASLTNEAPALSVESNAAAQKVRWLLYYSAASAGTLELVNKAEEEKTLAKGDKYEITSSQLAQTGYLK
jgi:hypothetical protein